MKFFLDTANVDEITELASTGLVDGITTNPSLIAASGRNLIEVIKEITGLVDGPVSAEVTATCLLYTSPSPRDQRGSGIAAAAW